MKTRIAAAVAVVFAASLGTAAFAQGAQQTPPPQNPPSQNMPQQPLPPPKAAPANATSSASMGSTSSMSQSKSEKRTDHKIKQALTKHGVTATHVQVAFNDGTATLTGSVFTHADIAKAKTAAMSVNGVKNVDTSGLHARQHAASTSQGQ